MKAIRQCNTAAAEHGRSAVLVFPWLGPQIPSVISLHGMCQGLMTGPDLDYSKIFSG
jgi:hypothetical protein